MLDKILCVGKVATFCKPLANLKFYKPHVQNLSSNKYEWPCRGMISVEWLCYSLKHWTWRNLHSLCKTLIRSLMCIIGLGRNRSMKSKTIHVNVVMCTVINCINRHVMWCLKTHANCRPSIYTCWLIGLAKQNKLQKHANGIHYAIMNKWRGNLQWAGQRVRGQLWQ